MNSIWNYKRIGDVCTVERGGSPRPIDKYITEDENGINWIKIGDTSDSMYITSAAQKIIPDGMKKSRYVQPGDFLLSNSMSFGRPYILKIDGCIHDGWLVLRDNNNLFDKRFLYYYLSSPTTYQKFKSLAVGGVVNNLNSNMVRDVEIPIPSIEEQSNIADILDKIKVIIDNRKQQLQQLDDLVKARFVEMFGECEEHKRLEEYANLITKGASPKWQGVDYCEEGTLFVTSENVREGYLDLSKRKYLDNKINEIQPRSMLKRNDILINIVGASIGRAAVYDCDDVANINQAVALVRVDYSQINRTYLMTFLNSPQAIEMYGRMKKGGARDNLSLQNIADLQIPVASAELQNQFATFVEQVDKSKVAVQKALDEAQTLFNSLMQEYFG